MTTFRAGGVWLSARLFNKCFSSDYEQPCGRNATTGERAPLWNAAVAALPLGAFNASEITAVRYGWGEDPCCPGVDRTVAPCAPGSCPISAFNSSLPAVPFIARVEGGVCTWNSIVDPI